MGTKQFNDKTIHRQQVKTGFVRKWENRSPGLFQDYSRTFSFFKDSISSQFCITQRLKVVFFRQTRSGEMVGALDFFDSDNNNNLTPVIKTGTTAQIEWNRIRVAPRSLTCIQRFLFSFFAIFTQFFLRIPYI